MSWVIRRSSESASVSFGKMCSEIERRCQIPEEAINIFFPLCHRSRFRGHLKISAESNLLRCLPVTVARSAVV